MKFILAVVLLGLAICACAQDDSETLANTGLTYEQVLEVIRQRNPGISCINLECRTNCRLQGFPAGFCTNVEPSDCQCVGPLAPAQ